MKSPIASLKIRVRLPDGSRRFYEPAVSGNRKVKPQYALIDNKPVLFAESDYYIRYLKGSKRVWECVGADAQLALLTKTKKEAYLAAKSSGVAVVQEASEDAGRDIVQEMKSYLDEKLSGGGRPAEEPEDVGGLLANAAAVFGSM